MASQVNIGEQLKLLVELQTLDSHLLKLKNDITSIPENIKMLDSAFQEKGAALKKIEDGVKSLQVKKKEKEVSLETGEGTIKKYQGQLGLVKTNKEYSALLEEINRVKADDSLVEEAIINYMDQIDAENKKAAEEKANLKKEEEKLAAEKKILNDELAKLKAEAATYEKQRADLAAKVDKPVLDKYNRLLDNRDGLAVAALSNDTCQGCFRVLPPQVVNEVRLKNSLVICEYCARILYVEE
ncbi:MAG: hypothetical protein KBB52_02665 [Candidatus Omnitrophica bacterium]|nr:hypothetical protein [Candidatus Omnitrophota bacterium]